MADSDITSLMEQIRETITSGSDGSLTLHKARDAYRKLARKYSLIEQKYVSSHARGFIKGLLHNHNTHNSANLTAVFLMKEDEPACIAFAGDRVLLAAMPELITRESPTLLDDGTARVRLGDKGGQSFYMMLKKMAVDRETVLFASVTSTPMFSIDRFEYCAGIMRLLVERHLELRSPVMMIYSNNITSEITSIFRSMDGGTLHADQYQLRIPPGSFSHAGTYTLTEFSNTIVSTLASKYPDAARIFVLTLSRYLVLYGEDVLRGLDLKRNRINFMFHTNSLPYKLEQTAIDSTQSLYLFLEKL